MTRAGLFVCASCAVAACAPAVVDAAGEPIASVTLEERFALSSEGKDTPFRGDALKKAVVLMDEHGVLAMRGLYEAKGVVDSARLDVVVHAGSGAGDQERRVVLKNCREEHVCAFLEGARKGGLLEKLPAVCRTETPCPTSPAN